MTFEEIRSRVDEAGEESFSRSGGPGGQNVNKVNTQVTLSVPLDELGLSEAELARVVEKLRTRITVDGALLIRSSEHRTQAQNREAARDRAASLLWQALRRPRQRKKTGVPKKAREERLASKRKRAEKKRMRGKPDVEGGGA